MPFLSTIEEDAMETAAKSTSCKYIVNLLQARFGELPESLIEALQKIDDLSVLDRLHLETIRVSSVEEFEQLIQENYAADEEMITPTSSEENAVKSTTQKNIINLLQKRFGKLPESLIEAIKKIDDVSVLDRLHLETVSVTSVEDFERLIEENNYE